MALAACNTTVDIHGRELVEHGTVAFPIACYHDDLGKEEVPWHWHEELEAAVITEGCCTVAAGKEKYTIRVGEGFFVNSGILHGCWNIDASACRFHSLVFHPRLVGGSLDSVFYQEYVMPLVEDQALEGIPLKPETPWQRAALDAIETAWQACAQEPYGYEFRVRSALSELILLLRENLAALQKPPGAKARRDGERMKQMLQYIQDHCADELTVSRIGASAAISESECLRCFRTTIGTTPIQYVRQYRIQRAAQLLATTAERVAEVSQQCGFPDVSYFTKTFRKVKGCTPGEFRRRNGKK